MYEDIKSINTSLKNLRTFGLLVAVLLFLVAGYFFHSEKDLFRYLAYSAFAISLLGLLIPAVLKPLYFIWMITSVLIGWFMTRVILFTAFYFLITPIGLIAKLFGKDFLDLKQIHSDSYWNTRSIDFEKGQDHEKQF